MLDLRDKGRIVIGIAFIIISFLLLVPGLEKFWLSKQPPIGGRNLAPIKIIDIAPGLNITIEMKDLPLNTEIAVKMGEFGSLGADGIVVGRFNSNGSANAIKTFLIPDVLKNEQKIAVRVEAGPNKYSYSWIDNIAESAVPDTGPRPSSLGFSYQADTNPPFLYNTGQSKIVTLWMIVSSDNSNNVSDICFSAFLVSPSFEIVPLSPDCLSIGQYGKLITWSWSIRPKGDSFGAQDLVFGVFGKMPGQDYVNIYATSKRVEIEPQNIFEQAKQVKIDTLFTPITTIFASFITLMIGVVNLVPVFEKSGKKNKQKLSDQLRSDYIIEIPIDSGKHIDALIRTVTEPELKEAKAQIDKLVKKGQIFFSKNGTNNYQSVGYIYSPLQKDWDLCYLKHQNSQQVSKAKKYFEPCNPIRIPYEANKNGSITKDK